MPNPSIRALAKILPYSRTTISDALRGLPRVNAETAREIRAAAEAAGFRPNPLASAIMSEMRRSRSGLFRGTLAAVFFEQPAMPSYSQSFSQSLVAGATARAAELGFKLETLSVNARITVERLNTVLQARGIRGLLLLPAWDPPDFSQLRWERYAGVYADYGISRPALHCVCPDHFRALSAVLERLLELGYRRPGLAMIAHHDERLQHRWEGAFLAFQRRAAAVRPVPPLVLPEITREKFCHWFRRHRPDVVLGHDCDILTWMRACGANIPRTHGFFCLNSAIPPPGRCAGLDQQPHLIGARAIDIVVAQLHRNEYGPPAFADLTTIPARWVDGPTIRATAAPPPRRRTGV